jgi:hypothetical protein
VSALECINAGLHPINAYFADLLRQETTSSNARTNKNGATNLSPNWTKSYKDWRPPLAFGALLSTT